VTRQKKKKIVLRFGPLGVVSATPRPAIATPLAKRGVAGHSPFAQKPLLIFIFIYFLIFLVFRLFYCLILFLMGQFLKSADVDFCQFMDGSIISVFSYKRSIICDMK
jgi:hypothetical protein